MGWHLIYCSFLQARCNLDSAAQSVRRKRRLILLAHLERGSILVGAIILFLLNMRNIIQPLTSLLLSHSVDIFYIASLINVIIIFFKSSKKKKKGCCKKFNRTYRISFDFANCIMLCCLRMKRAISLKFSNIFFLTECRVYNSD